jgi:hypothetical protein
MTLAELCRLNRTLSTGWQTYPPFESLRYLEVRYFSHGLLKIPAASALQELVLDFGTLYLRSRKPCDILLNFSQLPQLTTLRVHNLRKDGLTLTGKSRSVRHLELIYSSIDGGEVFRTLSSSLESPHSAILIERCSRTGNMVPSSPIRGDGRKSQLPAVGPVPFYGFPEISYRSL